MNLKNKILSVLVALTCVTNISADENTQKQAIKTNGQLVYGEKTVDVDSFVEMFSEGNLYGRLRNNNFYFIYKEEDGSHHTNWASAVGVSGVYNSARLSGFSFDVGVYGSIAEFSDDIPFIKAGKDTFSRFNYANDDSRYMAVIGQANLDYKLSKTDLRVGRQLVETFYTKSNDTKMIPNTFDGLVLTTQDIPHTTLKAAYLYKQKLRDHTSSHSVLMVGDSSSTSSLFPQWSENDDAGMLKGLTYSKLVEAGKPTDAPLIVLDVKNKSIKNLQADFSGYIVPELLSQVMGELNYKMEFDGFSITPGVRYIQQFDNGAGAIAGASLNVLVLGSTAYKNPNSLEAKMIAARVVAKIDDYRINLGYTNILDEADLVTPWRGFPTAGYTRSMGMYNWKANTKSYRLELVKGANKTGVYKNAFIQTSVLYIDGDSKKSPVAESMFYYFGIVKNLEAVPEFQYRVRLGYRDYIGDSSILSSYVDSRLEFNYLF